MKRQLKQQLISGLAIALTLGFGSVGTARSVSAQSLEDVVGLVNLPLNPLSLLNGRSQQPVNRNISGFSGNLNSNNFNICVLPSCNIPSTFSSPQATAPNVSTSSSGFARPGMSVTPNTTSLNGTPAQPTPPRPTLVVPPIKLPINLPL
ncbi:hypothetical protein IQ238_28790 [Pleurocapsales cyanobacterium LEGE 06147]|nr:hypothetical protein [Pleurocapsales cyanobacterium LEGE 06147]